jgi:hypothetical protein
MADGLLGEFEAIDEGDRIIADIDPEFDQDRGVATFEAQQSVESYAPAARVQEVTTGQTLGELRETGGGSPFEIQRGPIERGGDPTTVAAVNRFTRTDRRDLDPVGIGRDRNSGEFTPDNVEPAPRSPSDRDPDDGEFVTPDPRPITDIGRQRKDGLFDLF